MAKKGLELFELTTIKGNLQRTGWVLCVGAGISGSMFPDWEHLVKKLMGLDTLIKNKDELYEKLKKQSFSLDALIKAASDRLGLTDEQYAQKLSECLYSKLPTTCDRDNIIRCLTSKNPADLTKTEWLNFIDYIKCLERVPSALAISEAVAASYFNKRGPHAILSFNAETLLYALINGQAALKCEKPVKNSKQRVQAPAILDAMTKSISGRELGRIPYYFCHGLLRVVGVTSGLLENGSPEKLVFSEAEYLELANNSFSWQAATFTNLALTHSMIFIGLSFTDTNLRKWLSWIYFNRAREINLQLERKKIKTDDTKISRLSGGSSTSHYWLNVKPSVAGEKEWVESVVAHLGVRVIWLDNWDQVGDALFAMLGTKKQV